MYESISSGKYSIVNSDITIAQFFVKFVKLLEKCYSVQDLKKSTKPSTSEISASSKGEFGCRLKK